MHRLQVKMAQRAAQRGRASTCCRRHYCATTSTSVIAAGAIKCHTAASSRDGSAAAAQLSQQVPSPWDKAAVLRGAVVVLLSSAVLSTQPAVAYDVKLGMDVFNGNCAACHTGGKNVVEPLKTLDKGALEQYLAGGFNVEAIKYQVENGKGGMPAWQDRLDEDEIEAVANYVYETALTNGW